MAESADISGGARLIWRLLAIHVLVIVLVMGMVWGAVDYLAAGYFSVLMEKYNISPASSHAMFLDAVHRYLVWATIGGVALAGGLSFLLMRRALAPLTAMTDITRRISMGDFAARVPVRSRDEVGLLAVAFNRMADNLQRVENLRRQLVVDVAHELRTPLTNIRGYLEAMVDGVLPASAENFKLLQTETLRLVNLTEDILELARIDAARKVPARTRVGLVSLLETELDAMAPRFEEKQIRVRRDFPREEVQLSADPRMLVQVVRNLLENAQRYTPPGGRFQLALKQMPSAVAVVFRNTARNVDPASLPLLFERFYRGEKSRSRHHGGAGIGLAIVKELVAVHGGSVTAELQDGDIRITFTLPTPTPSTAAPSDTPPGT